MYTALIENLRWQAAYHRCDAETAKAAAEAIEKLKASYSQVTNTLRRNGFSSIDELLASYRQVKADFDALIEDVSNEVMDNCSICAHSKPEKCYLNDDCDNCDLECFCRNCLSVSHFVWRGRLEADDE